MLALGALPSVVPVGAPAQLAFASPTLTVNNPPTNVEKNQTYTFSVTGMSSFKNASYIVVMSVNKGELSVTLDGNADALFGYAVPSGKVITADEIGFEGTKAEVEKTLSAIGWIAPNSYDDVSFSISVTETAGAGTYYWPGDGTANSARYYKYVSSPSVSWTAAELAARSDTHELASVRGYLVRPSTWAENQFVANKVDASNVWIGARRGTATGISGSTEWFWVSHTGSNGPAAAEDGRKFFDQNSSKFFLPNGDEGKQEWFNTSNVFVTPWKSDEPNGTGTDATESEFYAATNYLGDKGLWNDFKNAPGGAISGFVVEYNAHELTGLEQASGQATFSTATAPDQVTGLTASLGLTEATLSWTAPGANNSAITSYTIEYADNSSFTSAQSVTTGNASTSATVSGLDGAVPTYFRVSATNEIGTGTASAAVFAKGNQVITWAPNTSLTLADSGLTLDATLTAGDGTLGYTVVSAGTTGCTISGTTLSFASTGSGSDGCEVRPTSTSTTNFLAKTDAPTVTFAVSRGTFEISSPSSKVGVTSSDFTDVCTSTCQITGFAPADNIRVVVGKTDGGALSGRVRLDSTSGLTQTETGYQTDATGANGFPELAFTGNLAQVNAALSTLQYRGPDGGGDETIEISASLAGAAFFAGTGHYYEFVTATVSWTAAKAAAANKRFNGLTGYLATITSAEENAFIVEKTGGSAAWVGGSDEFSQINAATGETTYANQTASEGKWYWVTGPEAGTQFWDHTKSGAARLIPDGNGVRYQNWNNSFNNPAWGAEPNNSSTSEHYLQLLVGGDGNWNDLPNTSTLSYVVEYGGLPGETALKQASTTFVVGAPTAPQQVSGLSVTPGNGQLVLSWTAPDTGGSAITDYIIEQFNPSTSTWTTLTDGVSAATTFTVTGLVNGTSYQFRVSAVNDIGTGLVSLTATGTPVAPPPAPASRPSGGNGTNTQAPTPTPITPTGGQVLPPSRTPAPGTAPAPLAGPLPGVGGSGAQAPQAPTALIGGRLAPVNTNVVNPNQLNLQTGSSSFGVSIPQGQGSVAAQGGNTELAVQPGAQTRLSGSGLFPGSTVQVFMPLGSNGSREIAQLPVDPSGAFDGDAVFTTRPTDPPLPIGRHVLQIASLNDAGERVVVEMAINIAQSAPAPEILRANGEIPGLTPGQSLATRAGEPVDVRLTVDSTSRLTTVEGDGWAFSVDVSGDGNSVEQTADGGALISVVRGGEASLSGNGFMPLTRADIWLFSDPTLLGSVDIDENGEFNGTVIVDGRVVPVGDHTLQIQGVGVDGFVLAANLGVVVNDPESESSATTEKAAASVLWWVVALIVVLVIAVVVWSVVRRRRGQAY